MIDGQDSIDGQNSIRLRVPSLHVELGGNPMAEGLMDAVVSLEIDRAKLLIDTAALTFRDQAFRLQSEPLLASGTALRIFSDGDGTRVPLFEGVIVGGEIQVDAHRPPLFTVRAFHPLHRLSTTRHTRSLPAGPLVGQLSEIARVHGWTASAPDRFLPSVLQNDRSSWSVVRMLAMRTGLDVSLDRGVLSLSEPKSAAPVTVQGWDEVAELRVVRSCEPPISSTVTTWDPVQARVQASAGAEREMEGVGFRSARPGAVADLEDAETLSRSLDSREKETADEIRVVLPGLVSAVPGSELQMRKMAPIVDGGWQVVSVRHEVGTRGARTRLVARLMS